MAAISVTEYGILRPLAKLIFPMHEKAGYHTLSVIVILLFYLGLLIYKYKQKVNLVKELYRDLITLSASEASACNTGERSEPNP
jgi:hypothetical protein